MITFICSANLFRAFSASCFSTLSWAARRFDSRTSSAHFIGPRYRSSVRGGEGLHLEHLDPHLGACEGSFSVLRRIARRCDAAVFLRYDIVGWVSAENDLENLAGTR